MTRKWSIANDLSNTICGAGNEIIYNTEVLKSNLCDFNNVYIRLRGNFTIIGHHVTQVSFKNRAPFTHKN